MVFLTTQTNLANLQAAPVRPREIDPGGRRLLNARAVGLPGLLLFETVCGFQRTSEAGNGAARRYSVQLSDSAGETSAGTVYFAGEYDR